MDVGEATVDAVVAVGEALVIDAEEMEHRRVDVIAVDGLFDGFVGPFVGGSVADTALEAAAGQPGGEPRGIVVSAEAALTAGHAAELGGPLDDRVSEEAAGFEIAEETGDRLIHGGAHFAVIFGEIFVAVPVATGEAVVSTGPDLDEADAAFDKATGDQAAFGHFRGDGIVEAV